MTVAECRKLLERWVAWHDEALVPERDDHDEAELDSACDAVEQLHADTAALLAANDAARDPNRPGINTALERRCFEVGALIADAMPEGSGFALFTFEFGEGGSFSYMSNADRSDMINMLHEAIARFKSEVAHAEGGPSMRVAVNEAPFTEGERHVYVQEALSILHGNDRLLTADADTCAETTLRYEATIAAAVAAAHERCETIAQDHVQRQDHAYRDTSVATAYADGYVNAARDIATAIRTAAAKTEET